MLYVTLQRDVSPEAFVGELRARGIRQWIYLGEDSAWAVKAEMALSPEVPRVSIAALLNEMSWKFRRPYIDWIGKLSELNQSLEWWASALPAKNPYHNLYLRICLLGVAKRILTGGLERPTLIVCTSAALFEEVVRFASSAGVSVHQVPGAMTLSGLRALSKRVWRYMRRRVRLFAGRLQWSRQTFLESYPGHRRRLLSSKGLAASVDFAGEDTVLLFTWVDQRSFTTSGAYYDPHLGPLAQMLRDGGYRVVYLPRVLPTMPFGEAADRLLRTGEQLFFPELYISDQDRRRCRLRAREFKPLVPADLMVCDIPVYRLAREHLQVTRGGLAETLSYECLVANLAAGGIYPRQIIHSLEGQGWEQVLAWAVRRYMPNTKVIGYDNGTFSRLVLSMYPASCEYGIRPLPDRIVTNGPLYREMLLSEGFPSSLVRVGCGLRHSYLWNIENGPQGCKQNGSKGAIRVLVATAIGLGDSVELVAKAARAFGGDSRYEVIVKCHPTLDGKEVISQVGPLARHDNVCLVADPLPELLSSAHLMLYTYSVVCYEALQHGVPPVFVRAENFLNLDPLESAPNVRWEATTPEDLRRVAEQITRMTAKERQAWQRRASEVVRIALAPITPQCVDAFVM